MTYARLDRCQGPPCPNCGCEDAEILEQPKPAADKSWWRSGRAVCRNCDSVFSFKEVSEDQPTEQQPRFDRMRRLRQTRINNPPRYS